MNTETYNILEEINNINRKLKDIKCRIREELKTRPHNQKIVNAAYWDLDFTVKEIAFLTGRKPREVSDAIAYKQIPEHCRICNEVIELSLKKTEYEEYKKEISGLYHKKPCQYLRLCDECREKQRKSW